ncbi:MAG: hypothetical protein ABIO72_02410 [Patescibacteria group bacterium]
MIHANRSRCPLVSKEFQWERTHETCCSLVVDRLADILGYHEEPLLSYDVKASNAAAGVEVIAAGLRRVAARLQAELEAGEDWAPDSVAEVEACARWFETVANAGFGVRLQLRGPRH